MYELEELIVICDEEIEYGKRLAEYFSRNIKTKCKIRFFSSVNGMLNALKGVSVTILLISSRLYDELESDDLKAGIQARKIIFIVSDDDYHDQEDKVYKYQSAREILSKLGLKQYDEVDKELRLKIKKAVQEQLVLLPDSDSGVVFELIDENINKYYREVMPEEGSEKVISERKEVLRNRIYHSIRGLDIVSELLEDDSISEIMINGPDSIFIEKSGRLEKTDYKFDSEEILKDIIQKIVAKANRSVNMASPIVDARLMDGSRVNVVLDPISLDGPILTIRRFPKNPLTTEELIACGAINEEISEFLKKIVRAKYNIIISGGTGSGKTTLLNVMSSYIDRDERIITIEDSAELIIQGISNLVRLETRNSNVDGCKEITIRDLIKASLRMRPSRVLVGEVRGDEAIDMLQAFSIGADGSMSTIHANSASDALSRLETLVMLNSDNIPLMALRRQVASSVDIIIQLSRQYDYSRKLVEIREVEDCIDGYIRTNLLYEYRDGKFIKVNELINDYKLKRAGII